eukprot:comp7604_c0_seq1/m.3257 comp7604_c0_seq1/g.3257  ORF comp7604_c0_seq1/g.3257 comp7604_c0_seq1/m.3257 type:complete len:315 (-) comp7604_c0_seq1:123-1067(-)
MPVFRSIVTPDKRSGYEFVAANLHAVAPEAPARGCRLCSLDTAEDVAPACACLSCEKVFAHPSCLQAHQTVTRTACFAGCKCAQVSTSSLPLRQRALTQAHRNLYTIDSFELEQMEKLPSCPPMMSGEGSDFTMFDATKPLLQDPESRKHNREAAESDYDTDSDLPEAPEDEHIVSALASYVQAVDRGASIHLTDASDLEQMSVKELMEVCCGLQLAITAQSTLLVDDLAERDDLVAAITKNRRRVKELLEALSEAKRRANLTTKTPPAQQKPQPSPGTRLSRLSIPGPMSVKGGKYNGHMALQRASNTELLEV